MDTSTSKISAIFGLLIYVFLVTFSQAQQLEPKNHLFKFVGIKNGFKNDLGKAREELVEILRGISSQNVSLISLDESGADWYSRDIDSKDGCPEDDIRRLLSRIKDSEGNFTRDFKMALTENFVLEPTSVQVAWRGPCTQIGRKRSQVGAEPGSELRSLFLDDLQATSTTTTASQDTTDGFSSTEPQAPSTTTDLPTTTRAVPTEEPMASTTIADLSKTTPEFMFEEISMEDFTTQSPTTTTQKTKELNSSEPLSQDRSLRTTTTAPAPTTTTADLALTTQTSDELSTTLSESLFDQTPADQPAADLLSQTVKGQAGSPSEPPHYGKYIGLAAAFAISVAYFVCSRAYKHQGMYELQH